MEANLLPVNLFVNIKTSRLKVLLIETRIEHPGNNQIRNTQLTGNTLLPGQRKPLKG
jgi:hypothetical protein